MLPTQLVPDDEGKILRVRLIMKEGSKLFDPAYLFDEGSTVSWIPCGRKLTCSFPGIKFYYGPDTWCAPWLVCLCGRVGVCGGCVGGLAQGKGAIRARRGVADRDAGAPLFRAFFFARHPSQPPTHPPTPLPTHPPTPHSTPKGTARTCLCWRWTASLTSWRS